MSISAPQVAHVVIDVSTALAWFRPQPESIAAGKLLAQSDAGRLLLHAPASLHMIAAAQLSASHVTQGRPNAQQLQLVLDALAAIPIFYQDERSLVSAACSLAIRGRLSMHQACALALAISHDRPLVTADQHLITSRFPGSLRKHIISVDRYRPTATKELP